MIRNTALQLLTIAVATAVGVLILTNPRLIDIRPGFDLDLIAVFTALLAYTLTDTLTARFEKEPDMGLFKAQYPDAPTEVTDGNGDVWKPAPSPGRNGEPVYYNSTGPDGYALTPTEIAQEHGHR